jgi:hypothetical protein
MNAPRLTIRYWRADPASPRRAEHPDGAMVPAVELLTVTTHGGTLGPKSRFGVAHRFIYEDATVCAGTGAHDGQGVDSCDECAEHGPWEACS